MKNLLLASCLLLWIASCQTTEAPQGILEELIARDSLVQALAYQPEHKVQIIYTQINRDVNGIPQFESHFFQLDTQSYYYPASTVKMPTAFLALEKINQLNIDGLSKDTRFLSGKGRTPQTEVLFDSSKADLSPTIAHYIKKIFLVSDNDAYNRLYELLGQEYINKKLAEKGFTRSRIIHRLSVSGYDSLGNRYTNPVYFLNGEDTVYQQGEIYSNGYPEWSLDDQIQGKAFMNGEGQIVPEAFDFTYKNYVSLLDLHDILKAVMFPESVPAHQRFDLTEEDYAFLYEYMEKLPRESTEPAYPDLANWDDYVKFLLFGSAKNSIPEHIRMYNKVGDAYGYLTDVAYIKDDKNAVEFMLAATIHVNANETFNDGVYEYNALGFPFLANLGKLVHEYEIKRK